MNVVDSCGWLEYFTDSPNAHFFAAAIEDVNSLIVPNIAVFEVCRRLLTSSTEQVVQTALSYMQRGQVVSLDAADMYLASQSAIRYRLALADAIIWQTAQTHQAKLYTQDIDLKGLPGVVFKAKPASLSVSPTSDKVSK